jgi:hypothetical protein
VGGAAEPLIDARRQMHMSTGALCRRVAAMLVAVSAVLVVITVALGAAPAAASCAGPAAGSAHMFTGVVVSTSLQGRVARVQTADGIVEVRGTPVDSGNAATSVDRTYVVGGRYEFHPTNAASPYADNACTATRLLGTTAVSADADKSGAPGPAAAGLTAAGAAAAALALVWHRRRSG